MTEARWQRRCGLQKREISVTSSSQGDKSKRTTIDKEVPEPDTHSHKRLREFNVSIFDLPGA